jgi:hypothetical protein
MSEAVGIAFYKTLLILPVPEDNQYFLMIISEWIAKLDKQIFK